ncbi:MAG: hypothetical protein ACYSUG_05185 [Planctomycetota bacterium]|jgi:outer membrane lipoprotein-sorting protein
MRPADNIKDLIKNTKIKTNPQVNETVLNDLLGRMDDAEGVSKNTLQRNTWRIIMKSNITKFAVATVVIIAVLTGIYQLTGSIDGTSVAFAQVLDNIQHCNYTFDVTIEPISQSSSQDLSPIKGQAMVIQPQKFRLNWFSGSEGNVSAILDYNTKQYLQLLHKSKIGRVNDYDGKANGDFSLLFNKPVERLWDLKDGSEEVLGQKELYGHTATGFKVVQEGFEITIWADSRNGLPIYVEALSEENNFSISTKWVMENFDYEIELNEELFNTDGPAEYTIVDKSGIVVRDGRTAFEDKSTSEANIRIENVPGLLIKPLEGVGTVKFGMTREQVIEILGMPDQVIGKHCLDYTSTIGLSLLVHPKRGLAAIDFWSQQESSDEGFIGGRDFSGKTENGIGINSKRDEIISLYGKANKEYLSKDDVFALSYPQLNTIFSLQNSKVIHISMNASR